MVPLTARLRAWLIRRRSRLLTGLALYKRSLATAFHVSTAAFRHAEVAVFHEFADPPHGGGHQFMRALCQELERRSIILEKNRISATTPTCLFNSFNFDFDRLRRLNRIGCRMVHRVDGPIGVYRGWDDGTDIRIWEINQELADATIFQSAYSYEAYLDLGFEFRSPSVIMNATNPNIFHPQGRITFDRRRKIRIISTSWSDNPNKGAATYMWLDNNLDWDRFEYTFVGRSALQFDRIRIVPPVGSDALAGLLRQHDVFIVASRNDPCSNALIEALASGLPAIYLKSGGHPEIVGEAGFGFTSDEEVPNLLDRLVNEYEKRTSMIALPTIAEAADRYLDVMRIDKGNARGE